MAIVQHEFGIYGGPDGDQVLDVLSRLRVPVIAVLHTVPGAPTAHQRNVLERIADAADAVVAMSHTAAARLGEGYAVDSAKVHVITHGAPPLYASADPAVEYLGRTTGPTILSWGLLGPDKGLEWAIDAMARLRDLTPAPRYLIAGQTHPKVLARDGEAYRTSLMNRAEALGVGSMVQFDPGYRDTASLLRMVRAADVVVLPYEDEDGDRAASGVLVEAVAALRPVVATRFPHARELLADGSGLLVDHRDPAGLAAALRRVLTEPGLAARMSAACARIAPDLAWTAVADRYRDLARTVVAARAAESALLPAAEVVDLVGRIGFPGAAAADQIPAPAGYTVPLTIVADAAA